MHDSWFLGLRCWLALAAVGCTLDVNPTRLDDASWMPHDPWSIQSSTCAVVHWNEREFAFCQPKLDWFEAELLCANSGAQLIRVHDSTENEWIARRAALLLPIGQSERLWLGGSDADGEGHWRWRDGEQFWLRDKPLGNLFASWNRGQPDHEGSGDNCLAMTPLQGSGWSDDDCSLSGYFVCQRNDPDQHD